MDKAPLVSIIIPCFKVEKYLPECIDSVLNQTLENIEIICVDDKSPDSCGKIIDEYVTKDFRIRAIHHDINQGLAPARNTGIKNATGEFIVFLDSDDLLPLNALEVMYKNSQENQSDIVLGDFYQFESGKYEEFDNKEASDNFKSLFSELPKTFTANDIYNKKGYSFAYNELYFMVAWMKLFKRDILTQNNILAPDLRCAEDFVMVKKITHLAKRISVVDDIVMYYRKHPESFTSTRKSYVFDIFKSYQPALEMYQETNLLEQEYTNIHKFFLNAYVYHLIEFTPYKMWPKFYWQIHKEITKWDQAKLNKDILTKKELKLIKFYSNSDIVFLITSAFKVLLAPIKKVLKYLKRKILKIISCFIPNKKLRKKIRNL